MKNSIYFRIFTAMALIVLLSFSLLGGLSAAFSYRQTMADKRNMMVSTLRETARYITTQHLHYTVNLDDLNLSMWLTMTSGITGLDLLVTNIDGVVESCSEGVYVNIGKRVPDDVLRSLCTEENPVVTSDLGQIYPEQRQMSGIPLVMDSNGDSHVFGYLFVTSDMSAFREEWRDFYNVFIVNAICVMILAFVLSFVAMKKQAEPLNEMVSAARRFARGEFGVRVKEYGRQDELGQLKEAFNVMADSLESSEQLRRDFITNLSHELKTPMTVITGFADGLLDGTIPREEEARYLGIISAEARRLSRLVRNMLEISTLQSTEASAVPDSTFDAAEVVRLALLSHDIKIEEKQLKVVTELPEETIVTRGDSESIIQVVYNLIDNAIKFSEPGGVIGLELWRESPRAYVAVTNRGEVIPDEDLPHIFDRFHKADKSRSVDKDGVGLGLYIVKKILDNHNEDVIVTSSEGVTKFIFSLTIV